MAVKHKFVCKKCKLYIEDTNTKGIHKCPKCNNDMAWDIQVNIGTSGDYHHVSDSLAINPNQIAEHREKFPDVNVLPDGRIEFNSYKQHDNYLKQTGFRKIPQKIKSKGKRLKPKQATAKA